MHHTTKNSYYTFISITLMQTLDYTYYYKYNTYIVLLYKRQFRYVNEFMMFDTILLLKATSFLDIIFDSF